MRSRPTGSGHTPGRGEGTYVLLICVAGPALWCPDGRHSTSVAPTQPVGYATPSVGSPGDGPQRRTCARERKVGRRDQRRRALPARVELITQVRRPQSGPRPQAGETCRGRNINRPGSPTGSGRVLYTFHFGGWVRLSSPDTRPDPEAGGCRSLRGLSLTHNAPPSGPLSLAGPKPPGHSPP